MPDVHALPLHAPPPRGLLRCSQPPRHRRGCRRSTPSLLAAHTQGHPAAGNIQRRPAGCRARGEESGCHRSP
uniref:Uncharacterized protein n=1 Tax=Arundo donax TaxID=35708 RepID=A0A0A9TX20_ARUDO